MNIYVSGPLCNMDHGLRLYSIMIVFSLTGPDSVSFIGLG